MLVESAIGNIHDPAESSAPATIDWLDLTWLECRKRFARKQTRTGREVRILLRLGQTLKHGDILGRLPDDTIVAVNVLPADVLLIRCATPAAAIAAAFQIGNLHLPIEVESGNLIVVAHPEVEAMLDKFKIAFERQSRRFQPTHWPDLVQLSQTFRVIRA
jgi:urease accessory protein